MLLQNLPVGASSSRSAEFIEFRHLLVNGLRRQSNDIDLCAIGHEPLSLESEAYRESLTRERTLHIMKPRPLLPPVTAAM